METVRLNRPERLREAVQDPAKIRIRACIQPRALAEGDTVQRAEARIGPIAINKPYVLVGRAEAAGADVAVIADVPDNVRAVAASLIVNATEAVKLKTTVPLTPLEMDAAAQKKSRLSPAWAVSGSKSQRKGNFPPRGPQQLSGADNT